MLTSGAYYLPANATLTSGTVLVFTGDSASRFVVRVNGNLTLNSTGFGLVGVRADQIVWDITGNLLITSPAHLPGIVLVGGNATLTGLWSGTTALLATGNITLQNLRFDLDGHGMFYSADAIAVFMRTLAPPAPTGGGADPCANLIRNPGFEEFLPDQLTPTLITRPSDLGTIYSQRPRTGLPNLPSEVIGWTSANEETPDGFRERVANGWLGIPDNELNVRQDNPQHTLPMPTQGGYAGIYSFEAGANGAQPGRREYIMQDLGQPLAASTVGAPRDYYVEFWSVRGNNTRREMRGGIQAMLTPASLYINVGSNATVPPRPPVVTSLIGGGNLTPNVFRHEGDLQRTQDWTRTAGCHRAVGNERFITIGNFQSDANANFVELDFPANQTPTRPGAYYYIDDVLVQPFPTAGLPVVANCDQLSILGDGCLLPASSHPTYTWTNPAGTAISTSQTVSTLTLPSNATSGTYTLTVTVPDASGPGVYTSETHTTFTGVGLTNSGVILITGNDTWTTDRVIQGTVRVKPNAVLTIDGAHIEFADTRFFTDANGNVPALADANASRIWVEPGGRLNVINRAKLTALRPANQACGIVAKMWDGIIAEGVSNPEGPQIPAQQPTIVLTNAFIENARFGVLAGRAVYASDPDHPTKFRILTSTFDNGGAIVTATNTVFTNCYTGCYLGKLIRPNTSTFTGCTFTATDVLADNYYKSSTGERYGMQAGIRLRETHGAKVIGCIFQGFMTTTQKLRGIGVAAVDASLMIRAQQLDPLTFKAISGPSVFSRFWQGIDVETSAGGSGQLSVYGSTFANNVGGVYLIGYNGANVRGNVFAVGTASGSFCYGLQYASCSASLPEGNTFSRFNSATGNTESRGLVVVQSSKPGYTPNSLGLRAYRNTFGGNLFTGIYAQFENEGFTFRCNDFLSGQIPGTDLEVRGGKIGPVQSACSPAFPFNPKSTANNRFSLIPNRLSVTPIAGGLGFQYDYPTNARMHPNAPAVITGVGCTYQVNTHTATTGETVFDGCDPTPPPSIAALRATLAATTDPAERTLAVSALARFFIGDDGEKAGLDSAIAVLQAENNPTYQTWLDQLQTRVNQYNGATASRGVAAKTRKWATAAGVGTAERHAPAADYFARVIELLSPFPTDSARAHAIATDAALHDELVLMAEDSLEWGTHAARTTLNMYAGTRYSIWYTDLGEQIADSVGLSGNRAAPRSLVLAPNPSAGEVAVTTLLPPATQTAVVVIYDAWGTEVARRAVAADKASTGISLLLRPGFYNCVLVADGSVIGKERLLISAR